MKTTGDVASAHGVRCSERKEAPRSTIAPTPQVSAESGTARGKVRKIEARVIITQKLLKAL